MVLLIEL